MPVLLDPFRTATSAQTAFFIQTGSQITLQATGLSGADYVVVEILELSKTPESFGDPCCMILPVDVQVIRRIPLLCPDGTEARLTAAYPVGVLTGPQEVTLGVRVVADPSAVISVESRQTMASGPCTLCICDRVPPAPTPPPPPPPAPPVYCASVRLSCSGEPGYGYHTNDARDPAATVLMAPCPGDNFADAVYVYPTPGEGHTVKLVECDGTLIGYGVNRSACAPDDCGCVEQS